MRNYNLDIPLFEFPFPTEKAIWTARHAVEGVQIFGGIGSGKTSGSGRMIALKYLNAGFGGLVLTVKPDEKNLWEEYCKLTNRTQDLIIVEPGRKNYFNFLDYEYLNGIDKGSSTENIVEVLKTVIRASEMKSSGKADDPFWETALDMLLYNVIDLYKLSYGKVSVEGIYNIVQSIPKLDSDSKENKKEKEEEDEEEKLSAFETAFVSARDYIKKKIQAWEETLSDEQKELYEDEAEFEQAICNAIPDARLLKYVDQFFMDVFSTLSEKTRSIIDFSFSGFLYRLLRDPVYSLFCKHESNFTPEDCWNGKIILINLPVKTYHKVGRDVQIMFKYIWQRAMEKRNIENNQRPLFLWADEAQNFLHEHDAEYQATARSSRIATVYISQNLPNYYANMGGANGDHRVRSFLGTLGTKFFHANADIETNRYASELFGDTAMVDVTKSNTASGSFSTTIGKSIKIERILRPEHFVTLKSGGPQNDFKVQGYIHQQGMPLPYDPDKFKIKFNQNYIPNNSLQ